jgi:hypothetical protein
MLAHRWGLKTYYYSLMEKLGSKSGQEYDQTQPVEEDITEYEECDACTL